MGKENCMVLPYLYLQTNVGGKCKWKKYEANEVTIFKNDDLHMQARAIKNDDGSISINAEDTAIGFGWTQEKNGKMYVKWERLNEYCREFGFSQQVGKDDYIPESLFYRLGMKASNTIAEKFQNWLALEVIPEIRKTGNFSINKMSNAEKIKILATGIDEVGERVSNIENRVSAIEESLDVLESGKNSRKLRNLQNKVKSRAFYLTSGSSINSTLWYRYFVSDNYSQIKRSYDIARIGQLPSKHYEDALEMAGNWIPTDIYLQNKIDEMQGNRDKGLLPDKKIIALLQYLSETNNGDINPFK